ncbi:MAG TPA: hypothetical protein VIA63_08705 [Candidatus Limnocylindria bacterium]
MRHAKALLPYVAVAVFVAGASIGLVFATVDVGGGAAVVAPPPPRGGSGFELSTTGRLAYWRQEPSGAFVLSVANLDGSQARTIARAAANSSRPYGTRWTGDGSRVAYVADFGIGVFDLDGSRNDIILPQEVRAAGFRIIDQRWSPSGTRVAATVQRSTDGKTTVYLGGFSRFGGGSLGPVLNLSGNTFTGEWLSDDEVLVESDTGVLGALRLVEVFPGIEGGPTQPSLRKLVDQSAASPVIDGGRIYFLAGPIAGSDASGLFVASPTIWSVLPDGTDSRRETRLQAQGPMKLDGLWPDGRYLMHVSKDSTQYLAGPSLVGLAPQSLLRRAVLAPDRRSALGLGAPRIVRVDLSRGFAPASNAFVVLLDAVISADVWIRRGASR